MPKKIAVERKYLAPSHIRERFTPEIYDELESSFKKLCTTEATINEDQLTLLLKAYGMSIGNDSLLHALNSGGDSTATKANTDSLGIEDVLIIVGNLMESPDWCINEMTEAYRVFDKDDNGYLDPLELKRVFVKLGEHLNEADFVEQINEFDIDGDHQMQLSEWFRMCSSTRGSDYEFND